MASIDEKRRTLNNDKAEIKEARVIANYGDPGLDEDYHFDILSRYVIVQLESVDRMPTNDKWVRMLAVVKRPDSLIINVEGGLTGDPTTQQRSDANGNVNAGLAANYSVNGIPRINNPYAMGETIKIRRLSEPMTISNTFFLSAFSNWDTSSQSYGGWHSQGATLPYFSAGNANLLQQKTIQPTTNPNLYNFQLNKYQYEAFALTNNLSNPGVSSALTSIFNGSWNGGSLVYTANGGYVFFQNPSILLSLVEYEDINVGNKQRIPTSECLPLVVTTPNSFPTPKVRAVGTIAYNPTYSNVGITS